MIMRFILTFVLFFTFALNIPLLSAYAEEGDETSKVEVIDESLSEEKQEDVAEATKEEKDAQARARAEEMKAQSGSLRQLTDDIQALTESLDPPSRAHFYMIYNNHNMISTVKRVRADVGNAVDKCSENNPEIEDRIRTRYNQWEEVVMEKLEEAQGNIDNMVIAQDYADEKKIRSIMKLADDLRIETMAKMERIPVTTLEACEYLLNKMDETQANMVSLLESALVSAPQAIHDTLEDDRNVGTAAP